MTKHVGLVWHEGNNGWSAVWVERWWFVVRVVVGVLFICGVIGTVI